MLVCAIHLVPALTGLCMFIIALGGLTFHSLPAQNIQMNRGHYSCLASLGPGAVSCSSCLPDHVSEAHVYTLHLTLAPQAIGDAD